MSAVVAFCMPAVDWQVAASGCLLVPGFQESVFGCWLLIFIISLCLLFSIVGAQLGK
jgi:UPF0716 family protein affecting phage T7 exclusion